MKNKIEREEDERLLLASASADASVGDAREDAGLLQRAHAGVVTQAMLATHTHRHSDDDDDEERGASKQASKHADKQGQATCKQPASGGAGRQRR